MENSTPHIHNEYIEHNIDKIPCDTSFDILSDIFKQLSDSNRLKLFWILCHCEECVINLAYMMKSSSPAISHHLKQLKKAGLITSKRKGKEVYYKASDNEQSKLLHDIFEDLMKISCPYENKDWNSRI